MSLDIEEMLSKEQEQQGHPLIRLEAARILTPRPWEHRITDWTRPQSCCKCGKQIAKNGIGWLPEYKAPCSLPDSLTDPMAVIAERLVRKVLETDGAWDRLWHDQLCPELHDSRGVPSVLLWLRKVPAERAACCIKALEGGVKP